MREVGDYTDLPTLAGRARARRAARRGGGGGPPPAQARVRCGGRLHRIVLTRSGRLSLPDHTREEVRRQLAGPPAGDAACRCTLILMGWRWFTKGGARGAGEYLPEALRQAAWERHRVARARREAVPGGPKHLDDLAVGPFHERPGFLTRVIGDLARRLWGTGVACRVSDGGPRRRAARELVLSLSLAWFPRPLRLPLPQDWFRSTFRKGLAAHEGFLVVKAEAAPPDLYNGYNGDFVFHRCRPAEDPHASLGLERQRVTVARGAAGVLRVVRRAWWD
jgi:hypothetical protein